MEFFKDYCKDAETHRFDITWKKSKNIQDMITATFDGQTLTITAIREDQPPFLIVTSGQKNGYVLKIRILTSVPVENMWLASTNHSSCTSCGPLLPTPSPYSQYQSTWYNDSGNHFWTQPQLVLNSVQNSVEFFDKECKDSEENIYDVTWTKPKQIDKVIQANFNGQTFTITAINDGDPAFMIRTSDQHDNDEMRIKNTSSKTVNNMWLASTNKSKCTPCGALVPNVLYTSTWSKDNGNWSRPARTSPTTSTPSSTPTSTPSSTPTSTPASTSTPTKAPSPTKKEKEPSYWWVWLIVILIIIGIVVGIVMSNRKPSTKKQKKQIKH